MRGGELGGGGQIPSTVGLRSDRGGEVSLGGGSRELPVNLLSLCLLVLLLCDDLVLVGRVGLDLLTV